jgi:hypothetical protein
MRSWMIMLAAGAFLGAMAYAQDDAPALGDVARQARAQKQQKDAPKATAKDAASHLNREGDRSPEPTKDGVQSKSSHVITDDEMPAASAPRTQPEKKVDSHEPDTPPEDRDSQAEQWKTQIQQQKTSIADLERQVDDLSKSIQYAPTNCVENCRQWNEQQQRKQSQADSMKAQLEEMRRHLEEMQDGARKQGFGSNVYDP